MENVIASHLARSHEVFYWKNRKEVDIVIRKGGHLLGIESNYSSRARKEKPRHGKLKEFLVLTKDHLSKEKNAVPAALFLALLAV